MRDPGRSLRTLWPELPLQSGVLRTTDENLLVSAETGVLTRLK